jgi:hypothetical protein
MQTLRERIFSGEYYADHGRALARTFVYFIVGFAILAGLDVLGFMNFESTFFTIVFIIFLATMVPFIWHMGAILLVPIIVLSLVVVVGILKAPFFFIWWSAEE